MKKIFLWILSVAGLFGVGSFLLFHFYLYKTVSPGLFIDVGKHYSINIPPGFAGHNTFDKGLLINNAAPPNQTENAEKSRTVLAVIATNTAHLQSTQEMSLTEPKVIQQEEAVGNKLLDKEILPDGGHLLIFSMPDPSGRRSFSGSYTKTDTSTVVFFSLNTLKDNNQDSYFLNIAKSIRYVQ